MNDLTRRLYVFFLSVGRDTEELSETDPMIFLVKKSKNGVKPSSKHPSTDCSPPLPDSSPPPIPKCAPPPLPKSKLLALAASDDDNPPPLPSSPIPTGRTEGYMNGEADVSSVVSRLKEELVRAHREKMDAVRERDKLKKELDGFLGSAEMIHEAKEALHVMRSERRDSAKSEQVLKAQLKDRREQTDLLKKETVSLKRSVEESWEAVKHLEDDRDTLTFIRSSLQKKMAEAKEENDQLAGQLRKTEEELADSLKMQQLQQQELDKTRDEVGNLVTTFDEKAQLMQVENESLIDDIRATRATAKRHRKRCQDLEAEKQQWVTNKLKLEHEIAALKETVANAGKSSEHEVTIFKQQLTDATNSLQQQKNESVKQIEKLRSHVDELEREAADLKSEKSDVVKQAAQQMKSSRDKMSDLEQLVQQLRSKLQSMEEKNKELDSHLKEADEETKALLGTAAQLSTAKDDIEKLEHEREELKQQLGSMSSQYGVMTGSEWENEKQEMHKEMQKFQDKVKKMETDKKDMMEYMVELEDKLDKSENESTTKVSSLKKDVKELRDNWKQEKNQVSSLETEIHELKAEREDLRKTRDKLQRETKDKATIHSEEVQSFQGTLQDLQQELEQSKLERESIRESLRTEYETKLKTERRKSVSVESQMAMLRNQQSALEEELLKTKTESSKLRDQLSARSSRLSTDSSSSEESGVFSVSIIEEVVEVSGVGDTADAGRISKPAVAPRGVATSPSSGAPPVFRKPVLRQTNSGGRLSSSAPASPQQVRVTISPQQPNILGIDKNQNGREEKHNQGTASSPVCQRTAVARSAFLANGQTTSARVGSPNLPAVSELKHSPTPPGSPRSRARWEQVKTVVVSTPPSKPKSMALSQPGLSRIDKITALPGGRIAAAARFIFLVEMYVLSLSLVSDFFSIGSLGNLQEVLVCLKTSWQDLNHSVLDHVVGTMKCPRKRCCCVGASRRQMDIA